jgi:hypothetical protein
MKQFHSVSAYTSNHASLRVERARSHTQTHVYILCYRYTHTRIRFELCFWTQPAFRKGETNEHRTSWPRCSASDLHSRDAPFESRPGHRLCWQAFSGFPQFLYDNAGMGPWNRQRLPPFTSFKIHLIVRPSTDSPRWTKTRITILRSSLRLGLSSARELAHPKSLPNKNEHVQTNNCNVTSRSEVASRSALMCILYKILLFINNVNTSSLHFIVQQGLQWLQRNLIWF